MGVGGGGWGVGWGWGVGVGGGGWGWGVGGGGGGGGSFGSVQLDGPCNEVHAMFLVIDTSQQQDTYISVYLCVCVSVVDKIDANVSCALLHVRSLMWQHVNEFSRTGQTALLMAVLPGHISIVEMPRLDDESKINVRF